VGDLKDGKDNITSMILFTAFSASDSTLRALATPAILLFILLYQASKAEQLFFLVAFYLTVSKSNDK